MMGLNNIITSHHGRKVTLCQILDFEGLLLDMNVLLWERNLDAVGVEGVIDAIQYVADYVRLLDGISPDEHLEVDARIGQFADNGLNLFRGIHPFVLHIVDSCIDKCHGLLKV